jgi:hypothetical protein
MAILIQSPKGKGFAAGFANNPQISNPYTFDMYEWYDWMEGWNQGYEMINGAGLRHDSPYFSNPATNN